MSSVGFTPLNLLLMLKKIAIVPVTVVSAKTPELLQLLLLLQARD